MQKLFIVGVIGFSCLQSMAETKKWETKNYGSGTIFYVSSNNHYRGPIYSGQKTIPSNKPLLKRNYRTVKLSPNKIWGLWSSGHLQGCDYSGRIITSRTPKFQEQYDRIHVKSHNRRLKSGRTIRVQAYTRSR